MATKEKQIWFDKSFTVMELLLGIKNGPEENLIMPIGTEFGINGFNFLIYEEHITYFHELNIVIKEDDIIDFFIKTRWQLVNKLIKFYFSQEPPTIQSDENFIKSESFNLATCVAFPLIEEMARKISKYWDEDGKMLIDQPKEIQLFSETVLGKKKQRANYRKGKDRISSFSHKLTLLEHSLNGELQKKIRSLNEVMKKSFIRNDPTQLTPLYDKLQYHRDMWLHGRKFDGLAAPFLSIFLSLIYFGNN